MRILFFLLITLATLGPASAASAQPLVLCGAGGHDCHAGTLSDVAGQGQIFELRRRVDPSALDSQFPVAVTLIAMADSEILWNGIPLARNGDPDGAARSGRFVFTVIVPRDRIRPGLNDVVARMRRPDDIWPIAEPVHQFSVAPFVDPRIGALMHYLPALLMGGALGAAAIWFGVAFALDRTERGACLLALAAAASVLQLALETSRAFVPYLHIWQPPRLALIAVLGAFVGTMLARYAAWRFAPALADRVTLICTATCVVILALAPGFDLKALAAFVLCMLVIAGLAGWAFARGGRHAALVLVGTLGALAWIVHDGVRFFDSGYYLALGCVFLTLAIEQARSIRLRAAPAVIDDDPPQLSEPAVWRMVTGARVRLERFDTIAALTAADDYTEVRFIDGRTGLHTASLSQAVLEGAGRFVRVHRSHAVNRDAVKLCEPRPGGGQCLTLEGGFVVPIGRTFLRSARMALGLAAAD